MKVEVEVGSCLMRFEVNQIIISEDPCCKLLLGSEMSIGAYADTKLCLLLFFL